MELRSCVVCDVKETDFSELWGRQRSSSLKIRKNIIFLKFGFSEPWSGGHMKWIVWNIQSFLSFGQMFTEMNDVEFSAFWGKGPIKWAIWNNQAYVLFRPVFVTEIPLCWKYQWHEKSDTKSCGLSVLAERRVKWAIWKNPPGLRFGVEIRRNKIIRL